MPSRHRVARQRPARKAYSTDPGRAVKRRVEPIALNPERRTQPETRGQCSVRERFRQSQSIRTPSKTSHETTTCFSNHRPRRGASSAADAYFTDRWWRTQAFFATKVAIRFDMADSPILTADPAMHATARPHIRNAYLSCSQRISVLAAGSNVVGAANSLQKRRPVQGPHRAETGLTAFKRCRGSRPQPANPAPARRCCAPP